VNLGNPRILQIPAKTKIVFRLPRRKFGIAVLNQQVKGRFHRGNFTRGVVLIPVVGLIHGKKWKIHAMRAHH
jgi:hypothetical protein